MKSAEVVIVGGGVVGASAAYHLAARGCREVLVTDRGEISCNHVVNSAGAWAAQVARLGGAGRRSSCRAGLPLTGVISILYLV